MKLLYIVLYNVIEDTYIYVNIFFCCR